MFLLFKNGLKHLFKEKVQLAIYVILIFISVLITSLLGTVSLSLNNFARETSSDIQEYNYSYKYTSSNYSSNDTATLSPWFAFDNFTIKSDKPLNGGLSAFPTLTFGKNEKGDNVGALLPIEELIENSSDEFENTFYNMQDGEWVNFHFGDLEFNEEKILIPDNEIVSSMTDEEKFDNFTSKGQFGDFYRFNFNSDEFNSSLIGQIYSKFGLKGAEYKNLSSQYKEAANYIFDYMFALNNSSVTDIIKFYLSYFHKNNKANTLKLFNNVSNEWKPNNQLSSFGDILSKGLNGQIGWFLTPSSNSKKLNYDEDNNSKEKAEDKTKIEFRTFDSNYDLNGKSPVSDFKAAKYNENEGELTQYASLLMKNFEAEDLYANTAVDGNIYKINGTEYLNANLFEPYNKLVAIKTNFKSTSISQTVMWNEDGEKFKFISAFYSYTDNGAVTYKFNNPELIHTKDLNYNAGQSLLTSNTFLSSPGYAKSKKLKIGKSYNFFPKDIVLDKEPPNLRMDGYAVDSLNTYPTIFDEDLISDSKNQGIIYISNKFFQQLFTIITSDYSYNKEFIEAPIKTSKYQDLSRVFLKYNGNNPKKMSRDKEHYQIFLANNLTKIGDISDYQNDIFQNKEIPDLENTNLTSLTIQDRSETMTINLKSSMLNKVARWFMIVSIVFILIFVVSIIFVVFNIVKRFFENQKTQLGNLKSMGYRKRSLVLTFVSFMTVPVIPIVFIGWSLSLGLQRFFISVLSTYFSIDNSILINWQLLLVLLVASVFLIGGIVWLYCFVRIKEKPLKLLSKTESAKVSKIFTILNLGKLKNRFSFLNKLRLIIISSSIKDIGVYLLVFFVSSFVLTLSSILPSTLKNMSDNYYRNINYNNSYSYNDLYPSLPLSSFNIYPIINPSSKDASNDELEALENSQKETSTFNVYFKDSDVNYSSLMEDTNNFNLKDDDINWSQRFETVLLSNILTLHNINISVAAMDSVVENVDTSKGAGIAEKDFNILSEKVLPRLFGQKEINESDLPSPVSINNEHYYSLAIKKIMSNQIPSTIKKMWDDNDENFRNFSIEFSNIPYDSKQDELATSVDSKIKEIKGIDNARIIGIDPDSKNQNLKINYENIKDTSEGNVIPVTVSKKMKLLGMKQGDEYTFKIPSNKIYLGNFDISNNDNARVAIDKNWWEYDNSDGVIKDLDKKVLKLSDLNYQDLAHTTFFSGSYDEDKTDAPYYKDVNGNYRRYIRMQNIRLNIPKNILSNNKELLNALKIVTEDYNKQSGNNMGLPNSESDFVVNPYDTRKYLKEDDGTFKPQNMSLDVLSADMTNWLGMAIKDQKIFKNNNYEDTEYKLKVKGYEDVYYGSDIYMNQVALNRILGFDNPDKKIKIGDDYVNMWSNIKFSKDDANNDQFRRVLFNSNYSNTSFNTLSKTVGSSIGKVEYVSLTKQTISEVISYTTSIAVVFIIVTMATAIIVIYLITDLFVGKYKAFMSFMKVQGYTNREINSVILWVFLPITVVSIILGISSVVLFVFAAIPQALLKLNVAVPLSFNFLIILLVVVGCLLIFALAYIFIVRSMLRIKLSTLSGQM